LEQIGVINQPVASIAKREEWIYVLGQENEPVVLDRYSPVLHLIQTIRDEAHRFAVTFHRQRRGAARLATEIAAIPGVGPRSAEKLLREIGSLDAVKSADLEGLSRVIGPALASRVHQHYHPDAQTASLALQSSEQKESV